MKTFKQFTKQIQLGVLSKDLNEATENLGDELYDLLATGNSKSGKIEDIVSPLYDYYSDFVNDSYVYKAFDTILKYRDLHKDLQPNKNQEIYAVSFLRLNEVLNLVSPKAFNKSDEFKSRRTKMWSMPHNYVGKKGEVESFVSKRDVNVDYALENGVPKDLDEFRGQLEHLNYLNSAVLKKKEDKSALLKQISFIHKKYFSKKEYEKIICVYAIRPDSRCVFNQNFGQYVSEKFGAYPIFGTIRVNDGSAVNGKIYIESEPFIMHEKFRGVLNKINDSGISVHLSLPLDPIYG